MTKATFQNIRKLCSGVFCWKQTRQFFPHGNLSRQRCRVMIVNSTAFNSQEIQALSAYCLKAPHKSTISEYFWAISTRQKDYFTRHRTHFTNPRLVLVLVMDDSSMIFEFSKTRLFMSVNWVAGCTCYTKTEIK